MKDIDKSKKLIIDEIRSAFLIMKAVLRDTHDIKGRYNIEETKPELGVSIKKVKYHPEWKENTVYNSLEKDDKKLVDEFIDDALCVKGIKEVASKMEILLTLLEGNSLCEVDIFENRTIVTC